MKFTMDGSLIAAVALILGNAAGASSLLLLRLSSGFWVGYGRFVLIATLVIITGGKAGVLSLPKGLVDQPPPANTMGNRERAVPILTIAVALALPLPAVLILQRPAANPITTFQTIQPGITYREVQAVLAQPQVASPLADSF